MKEFLLVFLLFLIVVLSGCTQQMACTQEAKLCPDGTAVGRNSSKNCEFDACPQLVGNDADIHGCIGSAGYSWCEAKQKCLRVWEETCNDANNIPLGCTACDANLESKAREFCGKDNIAGVFICSDLVRVDSNLLGGGSTFFEFDFETLVEETRCPVVAFESMTEKCRQLTLGADCVEQKIC